MDQPVRDRVRGCLGNQEKEPLRNPGLDGLSTCSSAVRARGNFAYASSAVQPLPKSFRPSTAVRRISILNFTVSVLISTFRCGHERGHDPPGILE